MPLSKSVSKLQRLAAHEVSTQVVALALPLLVAVLPSHFVEVVVMEHLLFPRSKIYKTKAQPINEEAGSSTNHRSCAELYVYW